MKKIAYLALTAALAIAPVAFTTGCAVTSGRETSGAYAKDEEIQAKIKTALYSDKLVKGSQVEVNSLICVKQLTGCVDSPDAKAHAVDIATSTKGVYLV